MIALPDNLTCRELVELVTAYLDGVMANDERDRFDSHLAECAGCAAYLDQMRHTIAATGMLAEGDLSDEAASALLTAFRRWHAT
jgi:anti-sigma factor RsiW